MADISRIKFKRSKIAGVRPTPAQLEEGELAINLKDRLLFTKDDTGVIVDLGFAKGGTIDGNVIHNGNYTQTGNYTNTGTISSTGNITTDGDLIGKNITAKGGDIMINTASAKLTFNSAEVNGVASQRAQFFTPPIGAGLNLVVNQSPGSSVFSTFRFTPAGGLTITGSLIANSVVSETANINSIETKGISTNLKSSDTYSLTDLVEYTDTDFNLVYKGRANASGTIWHNIIDSRTVNEWSLYTGNEATSKMFSVNSDGGAKATGTLAVGADYSTMGQSSIALGVGNTGFIRESSGNLSVDVDGQKVISSNTNLIVLGKRLFIRHTTDNINVGVVPPANSELVNIDTSGDANDSGGNGLTLLGYYSSGEYNHYFRGKGTTVIDTIKGLTVSTGGIRVTGASTFSSSISSGSIRTNGDIVFDNPAGRNIVFESAGLPDAYIYKDGASATNRRPGLRIVSGAPSGIMHEWAFGEDGILSTPSGINVGNGPLRLLPADSASYGSYFQNIGTVTEFSVTALGDPTGVGTTTPISIDHKDGLITVPYGIVSPSIDAGPSYPYRNAALKVYTSPVMNDYSWSRPGLKSSVHSIITRAGTLSNGVVWGDETAGTDIRFASIGASREADGTSYVSLFGPLVQAKFSNDGSFRLWKQGQGSSGPYNNSNFWNLMGDGRASFIDVEIRSDIRYKRNVLTIENALDKVHQLDGITYEVKDGDDKYTESAGLSAQDVEAILPMLVKENENGVKSLSYNGIVGLLVNAVKELSAKVDELQNK